MGWLWACLGGGPDMQAHKLCPDKAAKYPKSHRGRVTNEPHNMRLQPLAAHLPKHGFGEYEHSRLQTVSSRGKCGEPDYTEAFKIPTSSVNTCISINSLKKASERSLESSFRREFGIARCSDVDELREELAGLRLRLAKEEAEAKKLREEVSHLRSCGVLQKSEDAHDIRINQNLSSKEICNALGDAEAIEKQNQGDIEPVKQLQKSFSGPMVFNTESTSSKDSSQSGAIVVNSTQTGLSSHRARLSPKLHASIQGAQHGEVDERDVVTRTTSRASKVSLANNLQQYPSRKVAAWTSQTTGDQDCHYEGKARDLVILDSMDVHWIEVAIAPSCPSSFSTNVRRDDHCSSDHADSPRRSQRATLVETDDQGNNSQKLGRKRRQKRPGSNSEPTEKRSKEQVLVPGNKPVVLSPQEVEEQLSQAVAAFRHQKREMEVKHQLLCQGPISSKSTGAQSANPGVVGFSRNSQKKAHSIRTCGFQGSLSPVKENIPIEEIAWSRLSDSRKDSESASKSEDSAGSSINIGSSSVCSTTTNSTEGFRFSAEAVHLAESSTSKKRPEPPPVRILSERPGNRYR